MPKRIDWKSYIGKRMESQNSGWFKILNVVAPTSEHKGIYKLEIEFDEINGVKHRSIMAGKDVLKGNVKNPFFPSLNEVGYLGHADTSNPLYERWRGILARCYDTKNKNFKYYGGKGARVSDRWHCFSNFVEDLPKLEGYDEENLSKMDLDKDIKFKGNRLYSFETCVLVLKTDNIQEKIDRLAKPFKATSPDGIVFESKNLSEFGRQHGLIGQSISQAIRKTNGNLKGWHFEYLTVD